MDSDSEDPAGADFNPSQSQGESHSQSQQSQRIIGTPSSIASSTRNDRNEGGVILQVCYL